MAWHGPQETLLLFLLSLPLPPIKTERISPEISKQPNSKNPKRILKESQKNLGRISEESLKESERFRSEGLERN